MTSLESLLSNSQHLPALPQIVQELIASFDAPSVSAGHIAERIALDPVLTAKVLRIANTPAYGGTRQIATVKDAVLLLGFNAVRTLVLASGFIGTFKAPAGMDFRPYWTEALQVAMTCKWIAQFARLDGEVAFTAGMLHNIGQLLIQVAQPKEAATINSAVARGGSRLSLEATLLGYTYCDVSAELAQRWKLPADIVSALKYQEQPADADPAAALAEIIHLALFIRRWIGASGSTEDLAAALTEIPNRVLNINLDKMLNQLDMAYAVAADAAAVLA